MEGNLIVARAKGWPDKVLALLAGGQMDAAIAQIRVAPTLKDLQALATLMAQPASHGRWPLARAAVEDALRLLSAPRLHRSP